MTANTTSPDTQRELTESERWKFEANLKERELALREEDYRLRLKQHAESRWWNPLVVAIIAATIAALANVYVTYNTGHQQLQLGARAAENARVLEMLKAQNTEQATVNLKFLVDTGLINDPELTSRIRTFLATKRNPGEGPLLARELVSKISDEDIKAIEEYFARLRLEESQGKLINR